jgi:Holliday junction resolvasome RuvABC endonuclease subunit
MSNTVLGVDPGLKGALAFVEPDGTLVAVYAMPTYRQQRSHGKFKTFIDEDALVDIVRTHRPTEAWLEDVFSSSQMGVVSSFSFGEGKGILKGALRALGVELRYVHPSVWKRDLGCTADKNQTKARARRLFPFQAKLLKSEGKCEAALIALYGVLSGNNL